MTQSGIRALADHTLTKLERMPACLIYASRPGICAYVKSGRGRCVGFRCKDGRMFLSVIRMCGECATQIQDYPLDGDIAALAQNLLEKA